MVSGKKITNIGPIISLLTITMMVVRKNVNLLIKERKRHQIKSEKERKKERRCRYEIGAAFG